MGSDGQKTLMQEATEAAFVNVDEIVGWGKEPPPLAEPIIDGVLRRGHVMMLTGPPKAGKSWAMVQLAYAIASGGSWLGFKCREGTVAYVDTELDKNSLANRMNKVRERMGLKNARGNMEMVSLRGTDDDLESVVNSIIAHYDTPPSMTIIDSIYTLESGDENSAGDMRSMLKEIGRLASWGTAVVFAHHHAKGNGGAKNVIDRGSGSGVFGRFVDAMVDLMPLELDDDQEQTVGEQFGDTAVPMRMSFVLREFADPGDREIVFSFPTLELVDGLSGAPEKGSFESGRVKSKRTRREKSRETWTKRDMAIGRAVNRCQEEHLVPTRKAVLERLDIDEDMTEQKLKRWTSEDTPSKWKSRQREDGIFELRCTDETWYAHS